MSKLRPLFSGSSGNSIYIGHAGQGILIDAGKSAKQIEKALHDDGIRIDSIKAIFITHEHTDHVSGLRVFASRYNIKIYGSEGTIRFLEKSGVLTAKNRYEVIGGEGVEMENAVVKPFSVSHDCSEGTGYVVELSGGSKVAVCTDLGFISDTVKEAISGCRVLAIESNHDVGMLQNGRYPFYLKRRILSEKGHLSNDACAKILPYLVKKGTCRIVLSHLSHENNVPELAYQTALAELTSVGMKLDEDFTLSVAPKVSTGAGAVLF